MKKLFASLALVHLTGCITLNETAQHVKVKDKIPDNCEELGEVNVNFSGWGVSTEFINGMKNQTASKGGNALKILGDTIGMAYFCP